jgi:hypothetical protein
MRVSTFILGAAAVCVHPAARVLGREDPKPGSKSLITDLKTSSVPTVTSVR